MTDSTDSTVNGQPKDDGFGPVFKFQEKQDSPAVPQPAVPAQSNGLSEKEQEWLGKWLKSIDDSLRSIRSMLTFFTILTLIGLILGGCNVLLSIGR